METLRRGPFQGVANIIRFNWHFYVMALFGIAVLLLTANHLPLFLQRLLLIIVLLAFLTMLVSLAVSYYVYDRSGLYRLNWLPAIPATPNTHIVNIHAGFDETSTLLAAKFPHAHLSVFDFYDPLLHTEVSIQRARKAYPAYPDTKAISTAQVPLAANSTDRIYLILSAHEIRNDAERVVFFQQLRTALHPDGRITVVEHLRDVNNFLAYNIGAFHFLSRHTWRTTFAQAGLSIDTTFSVTPFIAVYTLKK